MRKDLDKRGSGKGGGLCWLPDHRVAKGQCRGDFPERDGNRKVPGGNDGYRPQWLAQTKLQASSLLSRNDGTNWANSFPGKVAQNRHATIHLLHSLAQWLANF